jgi:hypothetical protein
MALPAMGFRAAHRWPSGEELHDLSHLLPCAPEPTRDVRLPHSLAKHAGDVLIHRFGHLRTAVARLLDAEPQRHIANEFDCSTLATAFPNSAAIDIARITDDCPPAKRPALQIDFWLAAPHAQPSTTVGIASACSSAVLNPRPFQ